jgi:hypothetical protein
MMITVIKHEEMDMEQSDQNKGIIIGFAFAGLRWVEKWLTGFRIDSDYQEGQSRLARESSATRSSSWSYALGSSRELT